MKFVRLYLILILSGWITGSNAQCMLYPVSLSERIDSSAVIAEATVLESSSWWNMYPQMIYTSYLLSVAKVFKGNYTHTQLELVLEGGRVNDIKQVITPSMTLSPGTKGVFFLKPFSSSAVYPTGSGMQYEPFAGPQGLIKFHGYDEKANDPFIIFSDIETEIYDVIEQQVGHTFTLNQPALAPAAGPPPPLPAAVSITSFSPATVRAGVFDTLTINGTGFGTLGASSAVYFKTADDGGVSYTPTQSWQIISWSSTQIKVYVPEGAGTGTGAASFMVMDNLGVTGPSPSTLTVTYAILNVTSSSVDYLPNLVNESSGGFVFKYNTTFDANASAKASYKRALESWRCSTFVNFSMSATTTTTAVQGNDGENVIMFDGSSALPGGVLGTCYTTLTGCNVGSGLEWYPSGIDLKMRTNGTGGITWNYGPAATPFSSYDFESVCVHELGHGHGLGHIIASTKVMHYSISNGSDKRNLDATSDVDGGQSVMTRSVVAQSCGDGAMIPLNSCSCPVDPPVSGGAGTWTWTGSFSTDWFDQCNWDVNTLPDALSDVVIPGTGTAPTQPTISGAVAACNTLTINSSTGAVLTVTATGSLAITQ